LKTGPGDAIWANGDRPTAGTAPGANLPPVGSKSKQPLEEFRVFNKRNLAGHPGQENKTQKQNLPKMEKQNPPRPSIGPALVGIGRLHTHRKEPRRTVSHPSRFHDHLLLESKPHFMIILQLENAQGRLGSGGLLI
jgi:hypothetical protein